ncbi:MAG: YybH family protein [Nitrospinota bacterium]
MPARNPEELDRLFSEALNSGNLDALLALYEPQATLTPEPGQVVTGTQAIGEALSAFLAGNPRITLENKTLAQTGDIALSTANWELSGTGPDGNPMKMAGHSVEVARRQPDGNWLFVIDTPWGLEWGE